MRRLIREDFDRALGECDVIAGPTSPTVAFRVGERTSDPLTMYLADVYTIGANLAGLPGVSLPCGVSGGGAGGGTDGWSDLSDDMIALLS